MPLTLYFHPLSSFCEKALIALYAAFACSSIRSTKCGLNGAPFSTG